MNFIFWQNILSPHQSYIIRRLASIHNVVIIVEQYSSTDRLEQGWKIPDIGKAKLILLNNKYEINILLNSKTVYKHIFSGIDSYPLIYAYFKKITKTQKVYIIAESGIDIGLKKYFRIIKYLILSYRYDNSILKIYAIGDLGVSWFKRAGFRHDKIIKFQYTIDNSRLLDFQKNNNVVADFYRLTYIGQLISRKGIDNLICALSEINYTNWQLSIVGDGVLKPKILELIHDLNLSHKVSVVGVKNNEEVITFLDNHTDILILPSRFDGWGAVVNEALSRGVRVLTNDKCGASCMIENDFWGFIYKEDSRKSLRDSLIKIMCEKNRFTLTQRKKLSTMYNLKFQENVFDDFLQSFKL